MTAVHSPTLRYEPSLDGLRGVAIAGVVGYHACAASQLDDWIRGGFIGVSVFFTLSGYLITSLLIGEQQRTGAIDLGRFFERRIRRLSPALFTVVAGVVALSAADVLAAHASDAIAATWSYTNWHVIAGGDSQLLRTIVGPLGPTWSLAVEEQIYLLLVLAVYASTRGRRPLPTLLAVALTAAVVSTALAVTVSDWNPRLEFGTDVRAAEVAIGVALAVALKRWSWTALTPGRGDALAAGGLTLILAGFALVDLTPPWLLHGGYAALALVSAVTITGLLAHGRVASLLSGRAIVALGRISYSLYLVHWPVISVVTEERTELSGAALAVVQVLASLAVAVALHVLVEQPVRRLPAIGLRVAIVAHLAAGLAVTALALALLP